MPFAFHNRGTSNQVGESDAQFLSHQLAEEVAKNRMNTQYQSRAGCYRLQKATKEKIK